MWTNGIKEESGFSLVEVMVAIVVLTVAIIPMVGMFEAGLRAAAASGDYDRARACAGRKLEQARSLPYEVVRTWPPEGVCGPAGFGYTVGTEYVGPDLRAAGGDEGLMKVTVTVEWEADNSYSATGVVSRW